MADESAGIHLLLSSILSTQRETAAEVRTLTSSMATRDDISNLTRAMEDTIARREYDDHRAAEEKQFKTLSDAVDAFSARVKTIEDDRPPKWLWPLITGCVSIVSPILTAILTHWPRSFPHLGGS